MSYYIQRKDSRHLETVDESSTRKEAHAMLSEYQLADPSARHYISTRCCANWRNRR